MQKFKRISLLLLFFLLFQSFTAHKFYVSIFQINFSEEKKMVRITTRIFLDDLNDAIENNFQTKTYLGETQESSKDIDLMKRYLAGNFQLKVNGILKEMEFLDYEIDNNVMICYLRIKNISQIKSFEVRNTVLIDLYPEQQNIIQTQVLKKKKNLILTNEKSVGTVNF